MTARPARKVSPDARAALREAMALPAVTLPNACLLLAGTALWGAGAWAIASSALHAAVAAALSTSGVSLIYMVMHEAAHGNVSRLAWVNDLAGRYAALYFAASLPAFRFVHLEHHRHTNHRAKDPDHWSLAVPKASWAARWLTQDLYYYVVIARNARRMPRGEIMEIALSALACLGIGTFLVWLGGWRLLVFGWLLPTRLAIGLLSYAFNWLPHVGHDPLEPHDQVKGTVVRPARWLALPLLGQNLHLIHHLYPRVPFYRYASIWREMGGELEARGAIVK